MSMFYYWGPYVFKTEVDQDLINQCTEKGLKLTISHSEELAGNLDHQMLFPAEDRDWFYTKTKSIFEAYVDGYYKFHNINGFPTPPQLTKLWINFMKAGDYNPPHTHGDTLSFVLFLNVPKELEEERKEFKGKSAGPGSITFNYGERTIPKWTTHQQTFFPKTGDMYIFPAMMNHYLHPFKTKYVQRISMSGNITMKF